ncbi:dynamin GTPase [Apiospora saccharicola]
MGLAEFFSERLNDLCAEERSELMDVIDNLRIHGFFQNVSQPQIIVCGDQSSGKSSVLQAVTGVPFPINRTPLFTTTELVLQRTEKVGIYVSIFLGNPVASSCVSFHEELEDFTGLEALMERAMEARGISSSTEMLDRVTLRIRISGPDQPHLTIVDLPGLVQPQTKKWPDLDIQNLVTSYMKDSRSIILAVVSAKYDYVHQPVLKLVRSADPNGTRTLGSERESSYVSLALNQEVEFRLGWHVLKNPDSGLKTPLAQRHEEESKFMNQGIWQELPGTVRGASQLRKRLRKALLGRITPELPRLVRDIKQHRGWCEDKLEQLNKLSPPRGTFYLQQLHLLNVSESFQRITIMGIDGNWNDPFFGLNLKTEDGKASRLRAVVQKNNHSFAEAMRSNGQRHTAHPGGLWPPLPLTGEMLIDHVKFIMKQTRGRELPGLYDPLIVTEIFRWQAYNWETYAREYVYMAWGECNRFLNLVVKHVADAGTAAAITQKIIGPSMDRILENAKDKTNEFLKSYQRIQPITYNLDLSQILQKVRSGRRKATYEKTLKSFFHVSNLQRHKCKSIDLEELANALTRDTDEPDLERYAASEVIDVMEAYYQVALERFIDNIAVEVIEVKIVSALVDVLSPGGVYKMDHTLIEALAGESKEDQDRRAQLTKQLEMLTHGIRTCERFESGTLDSE